MANHIVVQGDCMLSIAGKYGFFWETLWEHPGNAVLKEKRRDPTVLLSGDVVHIPDKQEKIENRPTGQKHQFRLKNSPARLNIRLLDEDDQPRANLNFVLEIDGNKSLGKTDTQGAIHISIPPGAKRGKLTLVDVHEEYDLALAHLDPVDQVTGIQARLHGLGFYDGQVDGTLGKKTVEALKEFQKKKALQPTGQMDERTRQLLVQMFGV